jgi:phosphoribosylamine---glycine ligase
MNIPNNLKVAVIGGGGREHAICWKLAQSNFVKEIYCLPGNGGTAGVEKVKNEDIAVSDFAAIADFCTSKKIDLVVVGPDNPIADGIVDYLQGRSLRVFGPLKQAAKLESSKVFAKDFMVRNRIPTAKYLVAENYDEALNLVREHPWARVIKADGLALGKGVFVCDSVEECEEALAAIFKERRFGEAGKVVALEEKLSGEEISLLAFCDGSRLSLMPASQDHKRRFDGDKGPNTGGMGAYSPVELYNRCKSEIEEQVLEPIRKALVARDLVYQGVLYIGLMVETREVEGQKVYQPYVLEFNARFGDPETQAILPLLESDLLPVLWACTEGRLHKVEVNWHKQASCCVVAVTKEYPEQSSKGEPIETGWLGEPGIVIFQAGTKLDGTNLVTSGGRILSSTGLAPTLEEAVQKAYSGLGSIQFKTMAFRKDIARRAAAGCLSR